MTRTIILFLFISFLSLKKSFASYPPYYSHFYPGVILLRGQIDTLRGLVLLDPLYYLDSISYKRIYKNKNGYAVVFLIKGQGYSSKPLFIKIKEIHFARLFYKVIYPDSHDTLNNYSVNYSPGLTSKQFQKSKELGLIKEYYTDYKSFVYNNNTHLLRLLNSDKVDVYDEFRNPEKNITAYHTLEYFLTPIYSSVFGRIGIFIYKDNMLEEIPGNMELNSNFQRTKFIFKYLNKRYNTHFKLSQFASNRQMFDYISKHG